MSNEFYFEAIKKSIVSFMLQFADFTITRKNKSVINVPCVYGSKGKAYQQYNDNRNGIGMVFPAMSVVNTQIVPLPDRQKNTITKNIVQISPDHVDILKTIGNPTPVAMPITLTIRTRYFSDMTRILEKIVPQFQPTKVVRINLIPEMNLTVDIPITLTGITKNTEDILTEEATSVNLYEYDLEFDLVSYMFPPIVDKYAATKISLYTDSSQYSLENDLDDTITNSVIQSISDYQSVLIKQIEVLEVDYDRTDILVIEDISTELAEYGETLKVISSSGIEVDYCYEYDNGELYCSDELVPTGSGIAKTGNILINVSSIPKNEKETLKIWTTHRLNYNYASNILSLYNDFSLKNYNGLNIIDKSFSDLVYIYNNSLYVKSTNSTIENITKIFAKERIQGPKHFEININSFSHENDCILCGVADYDGNYVYIRCTSTTNQYEIVKYFDSVETVIDNITIASFDLIKFIYENDNWKVYFDSNEIDLSLSEDYPSLFLSGNFTSILSYNYIKSFKI